MRRLLFVGDIVGEPGLGYLETRLPELIATHRPEFVIANAENLSLTRPEAAGSFGMTPGALERLFAAGVQMVTGGNHSWDGPHGLTAHRDRRVLRPLNYGSRAPGKGAGVVQRNGFRLGLINLTSRTALAQADHPLDAFETQLAAWQGEVDGVLVDFHGESVVEKLTFAYAVAGRAVAVLGTHTHVPTLDTRILPGGTAYVSDVGMTGPSEGLQGLAPEPFVEQARSRLPASVPLRLAEGPVELGAIEIDLDGAGAAAIRRL